MTGWFKIKSWKKLAKENEITVNGIRAMGCESHGRLFTYQSDQGLSELVEYIIQEGCI